MPGRFFVAGTGRCGTSQLTRILDIIRHPEEVAASHLDQGWAPDDIDRVCAWLEPIYRRWLEIRASYDFGAVRYVEVRLEEMCEDWPVQRAKLFAQLGLPDAQTASVMDATRLPHWRALTEPNRRAVRQRLGFAIEALGYR